MPLNVQSVSSLWKGNVNIKEQEESCGKCEDTWNCKWLCVNCVVMHFAFSCINTSSCCTFKKSAKMWKVLFWFEFGVTFRLSMQRGIHIQHQRPEIWSVTCNRSKQSYFGRQLKTEIWSVRIICSNNCILPGNYKYLKYWNLKYDLLM